MSTLNLNARSAEYQALNNGTSSTEQGKEEVEPDTNGNNISGNREHGTSDKKKTESELPVSFLTLFKYSSLWDKVLIVFATLVAVLFGALWPGIMIMFGSQADQFVKHAIAKNSTNSSLNNGTFSDEDLLENMAVLCFYNAFLGLLIFIFNYIIVTAFSLTAANQAYKIQCLFMSSILKQDISWFDTHQAGDFASRLTGDLSKIQDGIGDKFGICISFISSSVLCAVCGLYYGWKLALVTLSITPILSGAMAILTKVQVAFSAEESKAYAAAGTVAEEVLSSIRTVMAFGGEQKEINRYEKCLIPAREKGIKRGLMTSLGSALTWASIFAGYAISFWYGVTLIVEGMGEENPEYTAGTLLIVFANILTSSMFIGQTAPYFEAFSLARGAAGKIFSIIERNPCIDSSSKHGETLTLQGKITIKDVHFKYPARSDVSVLNGVSLEVNSGETVALVGSSGCGKSTIVQLILRFYDPEEGSVEIDGKDVRKLNVGWLRKNIGFVGQEPVLFSTTIAENIKYGKASATMEEIVQASKLANVHDFITSLPLKYETLVGDRGTQLSGGQKQRIAVARALIKNPKILLLDEATSALDTESEKIVQSSLDQASKGRTTIIIAHRLTTIRNADKIFVLSDGMVSEVGNHEDLMQTQGLYYHLVLSQMKEVDEEEVYESELDQMEPCLLRAISHSSEDLPPDLIKHHKSTSISSASKSIHYVFKDDKKERDEFSWTELFRLSSSEWPYMVVGGLASLVMGVHTPIYGIVFGGILGVLSAEKDQIMDGTFYYCMIFLLFAATSFIAAFLQISMFSIASEKLTNKLRKMVFSKIITQDLAWFDLPENSVGSLCSKLTSDASDMQGATGSRISTLLQSFSTFVACIVIAFYFNYKIGMVVFAFVPFILVSTYLEGRMSVGQALNDKPSIEMASKIAIEAIDGIRTVASLHQEETFCIQFRNALLGPFRNSRKKAYLRGFVFGFSQSIQSFAYPSAFYYGCTLVVSGELGYPDLYKVLEAIILSTAMLGQAVAFSPDFQKAKTAAARILKLLDLKGSIDVFSKQGHILENVKGSVFFHQVKFNYPSRPNVKVLQGLNLEIPPGKTIALVGSSGSGKSTCVQLMERFYDSKDGEILLDEVNVKDLNVVNLRSHIGLVSQEPILFSCSIAENIAYGRNMENIDMNEIVNAARQANIHTFISALPQGYDTTVGSKGTQLSGGQKQRVAIARALLRNPKILLLDEATSALDSESERIVQEALDNARSGRTCLVIAHRLSTVQNADSIAVLHKGRVVEQGRHQDLLKQKGYYYKLYYNQFSSR